MDNNVVDFNEAGQIFFYNNIWSPSNEEYWYEYAWEILERAGMTKFNTEMERNNIFIYALVLKVTYNEFCETVFGEYGYNDELFPLVEDLFNAFEIGQMVAPFLEDGNCMDEVEDGLWLLVNKYKSAVYSALLKELNQTEIFAFMYCTNHVFTKEVYDEECERWEEEEICISDLEDYQKQVRENMEEIVDEATIGKVSGFEFIGSLG